MSQIRRRTVGSGMSSPAINCPLVLEVHRQIFKISKVGAIAGSFVRDGEVRRNARTRVKRGGKVIVENLSVSSLKRFNEDVREVRAGFECGIGLDGFNDFREGDVIEFYVTERVS